MNYEYTAYFDVGISYHDGTDDIKDCFYGWVLLKNKDIIDWDRGKIFNINTTTSGEMISCSKILKHVLKNKDIKKIQIYGDCQTSIDALNNLYKPQGATTEYYDYTMSILNNIKSIRKKVKLNWIPRKFNKLADRLASKGILEKYVIRHYENSTEKSFGIFHYSDLICVQDNGPVQETDAIPIKKGLTLNTAIKLKKIMEEFKTFDEVKVWLTPTKPLNFIK